MILALLPSGLAHADPSVAEPFRTYYDQYQGMRVLGYPMTDTQHSILRRAVLKTTTPSRFPQTGSLCMAGSPPN